MKEYVIGNKVFLKKGGRYVPKEMFQDGGETFQPYEAIVKFGDVKDKMSSFINNQSNDASQAGSTSNKKWYNSPSTIGLAGNFAATTLNSLADKPNPGSSQRVTAAMKD